MVWNVVEAFTGVPVLVITTPLWFPLESKENSDTIDFETTELKLKLEKRRFALLIVFVFISLIRPFDHTETAITNSIPCYRFDILTPFYYRVNRSPYVDSCFLFSCRHVSPTCPGMRCNFIRFRFSKTFRLDCLPLLSIILLLLLPLVMGVGRILSFQVILHYKQVLMPL